MRSTCRPAGCQRQAGYFRLTTERQCHHRRHRKRDGPATATAARLDQRQRPVSHLRQHATNLVPGDTNGQGDTFVYDRQTQTIQRISVASDGSQGDGDSTLGADCCLGANQGAFVPSAARRETWSCRTTPTAAIRHVRRRPPGRHHSAVRGCHHARLCWRPGRLALDPQRIPFLRCRPD